MHARNLIVLIVLLVGSVSKAQNINNPSFDSIYFGGIDRIFEWVTSDGVGIHGASLDTIVPLQPNTFYDASGLQYSEILDLGVFIDTSSFSNWALRLKSQPQKFKIDGSPYESYVVNGTHFYTDSIGYIDFSTCGTPFTGTPTALTGYYMFIEQSAVPNFGQCEILLKHYNVNTHKHDTIAYAKEFLTFNYSPNWQQFTIPINYVASTPPDSIVVVFKAAATPHLPTTFWVDELSFEYGGIGQIEYDDLTLKIYPNPVGEILRIENVSNQKYNFRILNTYGQLIQNGNCLDEISVESLKKGSYFLILENEPAETQKLLFLKK